LLSSLAANDLDLLAPHLEAVMLGFERARKSQTADHAVATFPRAASRPSIAIQSNGKQVEVELIGREA